MMLPRDTDGAERMWVDVSTDGTAASSHAIVQRDYGPDYIREEIKARQITRSSCSVQTFVDGSRCITATVWTRPGEQGAST